MARSAPRKGIAKETMKLLGQNPKDLWTWADLLENLPDANEKAVQNCIHRLYVEGKVKRHIDDEEDTRRKRYAIDIPPSKCDEYVKSDYKTSGVSRKKGKRGSKSSYSSREIRTAFAQAMNTLAQLEDMVSTVVDLAEDTEKKMQKIENLLR